jgi:predicted O-methyltransferase YrrM
MVIMAALSKPCVVLSGAREGVRWQLNPDHRFLYMNGAMKCATYDGCWKSKLEECVFKSPAGQPMCMELIRPEDVARAVELYYLGGRLKLESNKPEILFSGKEKKMEEKKNEGPAILDLNLTVTGNTGKKAVIIDVNNDIKMEEIPEFYRAPQVNSAIFNTLRILKKLSPTDTYLEAYLGHYAKRKETFMDTYHFMWFIGSVVKPRRILEIGSRTGISICQLLSAFVDHSIIENIVLCDLFNDGLCTPELVFKNLQHLNIPTDKVKFLLGDSLTQIPAYMLRYPDSKFDYILVDGCHDKDYARQDLANAVNLLDVGGYILFDDITEDGCSLQDVWDQFKELNKANFIFGENHDGKGIGYARRLI